MSSMFRSLVEPNYRTWFIAGLVSNTGTWMQRTAQDWIVLTQLTNNSASALGITMALQLGPQLVLFPIAGAMADKFNKRKLLIVTQAGKGVCGLILFALLITGVVQLWHVYVLAALLGVVATIDTPARQAFVSELVGEDLVPNAVSLNSASFNGARMFGPAIAGVLTAWLGAGPVFLLSGLGFAATIAALLALDRTRLRSTRAAKGEHVSMLGGFRYLRTRGDIVVVLAVLFMVATFGMNFALYIATMARIEFGHDASGFGFLSSIMAIGSVAGALAAARRERPRLRYVFWASGTFGVFTCLAALMPSYGLFAAVLICVGFSTLTMMTGANSYVQTTTPAMYRGRVMAIYAAVVMGGTPIGAPIAGWVADTWGPRASMLVGGVSGIIAILIGFSWMVTSRNMRLRYEPRARFRVHLSYDGRK